jgi:hypothetical protein
MNAQKKSRLVRSACHLLSYLITNLLMAQIETLIYTVITPEPVVQCSYNLPDPSQALPEEYIIIVA